MRARFPVWLDALRADLRYAWRALRASPGFATVAILSLALGIGANAAIFTLINAVVFRSLPVTRPEELVLLSRDDRPLTHAMWEALRQRQRVFAGTFAYATSRVDLSNGGEARRVPMGFVSGDYFTTLGVQPAIGRTLIADDDRAGCEPVAIISHEFWQSEYAGSATAIGKSLSLDGHPFQVVGVTRPAFFGIEIGYHVPIWVPLCAEAVFRGPAEAGFGSHMGRLVIGRMKPGVTVSLVRAHVAALRPAILEATLQYSAPKQGILMSATEYRKTTFGVTPFATGDPALRLTYGDGLFMLMTVVAVVLLIACANVANLLLARAAARQREIAVRLALGASRARLVRQLMTEGMLLSGLGAAAGALFAVAGSRLVVGFFSTPAYPISLDLSPDWRIVAFTIAIALATGVLFGIAPAWRAGRVDPYLTMKPGSRGVIAGHSRFGLGKGLVVAQIALSLVSIMGAALLLGTWKRLASIDPGYERDHVLLVGANTSGSRIAAEQRAETYRRIVESLRLLPGVAGVGAGAFAPLTDSWNTVIGADATTGSRGSVVRMNEVSDGYFAAVGTPVLAGRDFGTEDTRSSPRVAIVSATLARRFVGGQAAIGQRVRFGSPPNAPVEIVGIVADTKQGSLRDRDEPMVYFPLAQDSAPDVAISIAVRTAGLPESVVASVKAALAEVDPRISLTITTMARRLDGSLRLPRTLGLLAGFFGTLALLLAAIGLYGIMAYTVARRRAEIGIRVALGAARGRVVRLVLGDVARLVAAGVAIGVALSLSAGHLVASMLFGVEPNDVPTLALSTLVLIAVALAAAAYPAHRASRVDPMTALRED